VHLLVAHPDPEVRRHFRELCSRSILSSAMVIEAASAEECLYLLSEVDIDLAIVPPRLPAMRVEDLLMELEQLDVHVPVVVYGSIRDLQRRRDLAEGGVAAFLSEKSSARTLDGVAMAVTAPYVGRRTSAA